MDGELVKYRVRLPSRTGASTLVDFTDPVSVRESRLPLPRKVAQGLETAVDVPRRVLVLGTFGAGKSSVIRHLLGTVDDAPGFPAISPHKTTIAPTEVICATQTDYEAVVTFAPQAEIEQYLRENVSAACRQAARGKTDKEVSEALLVHADQRLRLNYLLGKFEDIDALRRRNASRGKPSEAEIAEAVRAQESLKALIDRIRDLSRSATGDRPPAGSPIDASADGAPDEDSAVRLVELIEGHDGFPAVVDDLRRLVLDRVLNLPVPGALRRDASGWPELWTFVHSDRTVFLDALGTFTGNADYRFRQTHRLGALLTPIVNGVRVRGPFKPEWEDAVVPVVLLDTQGLGHVVDGRGPGPASVPNQVARWMRHADAVVLVDSGKQPMHEDPPEVLRTVATMGATRRFFLLFSHMDQVRGGPIATQDDAEDHVWQSVNAVLGAVGEELGPRTGEMLRRRLEAHTYYAAHLNERLNTNDPDQARTTEQLAALLRAVATIDPAPPAPEITPVYTAAQVAEAVARARKKTTRVWDGIVGVERSGNRHWATIRALTVRLSRTDYIEGWNGLFPAADVRSSLQSSLHKMLRNPSGWVGSPTAEERHEAIDDLVAAMQSSLSDRLIKVSRARTVDEQRSVWWDAALQSGPGSTRVRAELIRRIMANAFDGDGAAPVGPIQDDLMDMIRALRREDGTRMVLLS